MNRNFEIYNYLNLINRRVAKAYKQTGKNPLPSSFVVNKEAIKERLYLNQMQSDISFPAFLFEDNKDVKKRFKSSVKQLKELQSMLKDEKFTSKMSKKFVEKFDTYLKIRIFVTQSILKEFKRYYFNECDAYEEICAIDTIFFDLLDGTFEPEVDVRKYLDDLENKYKIYHQERINRLPEKVSEQTKKKREKQKLSQKQELDLNKENLKKNIKKIKSDIKKEKKNEKIIKSREISKFKQEKEKKIIQNKTTQKNKEK